MKRFTFIKVFLIFSFIFLTTNCSTEEINKQNIAQSSSETKIWFESHKNDYNATVLQYIKELQWENAIITNGENGQVTEVPFLLKNDLSATSKEGDLYNDHHRLMFVKNEDEEFKIFYIQIFTKDKNYNNLDQNVSYYNIEDNFDGEVFVQELSSSKGTRLEFADGKKVQHSVTAKMQEMACLYYGYWDGSGKFNPLYEVACYSGGPTGNPETPGTVYGGGTGTTPHPSTSCPEGYVYKFEECVLIELPPPSCESFNFVKTTGLWQVALVKNVRFKVFLLNDKGVEILHWIDFPKPIAFGTPTNIQMGDTDITPGLAANASARVLQRSMQDVIDKYGHTRTSDLTVSLYFEERLKHNYPLSIPGARVNFNAVDNMVATEYKTNLWTAGDCN